jgi:hypothetical protein
LTGKTPRYAKDVLALIDFDQTLVGDIGGWGRKKRSYEQQHTQEFKRSNKHINFPTPFK